MPGVPVRSIIIYYKGKRLAVGLMFYSAIYLSQMSVPSSHGLALTVANIIILRVYTGLGWDNNCVLIGITDRNTSRNEEFTQQTSSSDELTHIHDHNFELKTSTHLAGHLRHLWLTV
jgi:hypothetical protein